MIVHPSDMAQLSRIVEESPEVYRELYPAESTSVETPAIPELSGWRGRLVRWLKRIIQIIEQGEMTND
ncbi:hypothetical protein MKZ12_09880 [Paenibacillus sp. FSL R5-0713]|uniref:hypothetical protein n=1 Tax=Paenibacillus sp. FSL R5-0713 TaxID=2921655 RepID=UPI0030DC5FDD